MNNASKALRAHVAKNEREVSTACPDVKREVLTERPEACVMTHKSEDLKDT